MAKNNAPKRQHILPRFLLKGFAKEKKKKGKKEKEKYFIWQYSKSKALLLITTNTELENNYYTDGDDGSVDEKITSQEKKLSKLLDELRVIEGEIPEELNESIAELILHMTTRSRNIRDSFRDEFYITLKKWRLYWIISLLARLIGRDPKHFFEETIKKAHLQALGSSNLQSERAKSYLGFKWSCVQVEKQLVLGDSAIIFQVSSTRKYKPFSDKDDVIERIFFPIKHDRLLVGYKEKLDEDINTDELNLETIRCSSRYYYSLHEDSDLESLSIHIGSNSHLIDK